MCSRTVILDTTPRTLTCWNNTIAVGSESGSIVLLNAITGSQLAVLSKHIQCVRSLTFSLDGTLLVSGSSDSTVLLWDVQTGGVVKSFCGHTEDVLSVSISLDCTTIASGSWDNTICLWDIQTGVCHCVINRDSYIRSVCFSPTISQLLISGSRTHIEQWDSKGCQIGSTYGGSLFALSLDGSCFVSWRESAAIVQNSNSGAVVAKIQVPGNELRCCCLSPNGNFVAGGTGHTIYVWDITDSNPRLIKTLVGHTNDIASLTFSSSLTSASEDGSVKFWQIGASPKDQVTTGIMATPHKQTRIESVSLQVKDGIVVTRHKAGEVKTWDLTTGLCKASFQTPAKGSLWSDIQLIEGRLVLVWWEDEKIHIWEVEKEEHVQIVHPSLSDVDGIRISGDGLKIFCLKMDYILALSMSTHDIIGEVELEGYIWLDPLRADGSKIWVWLDNSSLQQWDFGTLGSSPILLSNAPLNRPQLDLVDGHLWWKNSPNKIRDTITGKEVFQLSGRYGNPCDVQWDGRYLVAGYKSGEVLILDFNCVHPQ